MNVKELKEQIADFPDDMEIIIQKDAEGNGYSPLSIASNDGIYIAETTWRGEMYSDEWTAEDACMDDDEWEEMLKRPRCLVLVPVN